MHSNSRPDAERPEISVVVPLCNEEQSVGALAEQVRAALGEIPSWELLLVDDGSTDGTRDRIARLAEEEGRIRAVFLARNYGQTAAMQAGFDLARGRVVVSMDGDLQNDPADIPRLVAKLDEGYDLVTGYRLHRQDQFLTRKVPSWFANQLIRKLTGVKIRDTGCSLKAYRNELVRRLHLYSDMHRFIPAVAVGVAGATTAEIPVQHHPRREGTSKYGLSRTWKVILDLLVIKTIRSFRDQPLVLFAAMSVVAFLASAAFGVASVVAVWTQDVVGFVLPSLSAVTFGLGAYLLMLGLLAEAALFHGRTISPSDTPLSSAPDSRRRAA